MSLFSVLRSIFEKKDKDNSGSIEAKELGKCLRVIGFSPTKEDVEFLVKHFDTNGTSELFQGLQHYIRLNLCAS